MTTKSDYWRRLNYWRGLSTEQLEVARAEYIQKAPIELNDVIVLLDEEIAARQAGA